MISSPDDAEIHRLLHAALARHQAGELAAAEREYQRVLRLSPSHPEALRLLGILRYQAGNPDQAVGMLQRAVESAPDHVDALCNLGLVLNATGNPIAAEQVLQRAIDVNPAVPAVYNTLGSVMLSLGEPARAIAAYEKAVELEPGFIEALVNLANALLVGGRADAALAPCQKAISLAPEIAEAQLVLGNICASLDRKEDATAAFRRACELSPNRAEHWCSLASGLEAERNWDEALICFDRAYALDHESGAAISGGLLMRKSLLRWDDLDVWSSRFATGVENGIEGLTPFIYLAEPSSAHAQLQCATLWSRHIAERVAPLRSRLNLPHSTRARDKITLGYVSYDFRRHPTAYTKVGLFENHDRARFKVFGYCNGPDDDSDIRRRVISAFDQFTDVAGWPAGDVARKIHSDGVDILIDLKGHTLEAPTEVFALRPAPIQVNYKGYPGTIGAGFIDYIIADEFVLPEEQQDAFSEEVVYLPETYWVDDCRRALPASPPNRKSLGLPERGTVFCGFNNSYKIGAETFEDWAAIVSAVPGSVLWIQDTNPGSSLSQNLRREAARRGLDPDRLVFAPKRPLRQYLALLTVADLFLDTRPYNGHTTASDALWVGLPVLTLPGTTFAARVAGSMLRTLGLPELIADSREDYREKAIDLGRDPDKLETLSRRLRAAARSSPLYDTARLTRHMETAYEMMVRDFLAGRPPLGFKVPALSTPMR